MLEWLDNTWPMRWMDKWPRWLVYLAIAFFTLYWIGVVFGWWPILTLQSN